MKRQERLETETIYADGYSKVEFIRDREPNRRIYKGIVLESKPGVIILPLHGKKLVLIRQYRHAVRKWVYELPAGLIEAGETPIGAAARELKEETGFAAKRIAQIFRAYPEPGREVEMQYFFLAECGARGAQRLDKDEFIKVYEMTPGEVKRGIRSGRIKDGKTMDAVLFYFTFLAGGKKGT